MQTRGRGLYELLITALDRSKYSPIDRENSIVVNRRRGRAGFGVIVILLSVAGCATSTDQYDRALQNNLETERTVYALETRYSDCREAPIGAKCGLIFDSLDLDAYKQQSCDLQAEDPFSDACMAKFIDDYYSGLRKRYPLADLQQLHAYCKGREDRCDSLRKLEVVLLASHNAQAEQQHEQRLAELHHEHAEKVRRVEEEDREARAKAVHDIFLVVGAAAQGFANASNQNNSGCCSSHRGICACQSGVIICCDDVQSPSCRC